MASSSGNKDQDKGFSGNRVPSWDGRPESFHHYMSLKSSGILLG